MDTLKTPEEHNLHRRRFCGTAAMTVAAAQLGLIGAATARSSNVALPATKPGTNTSFASIKQINAGDLNIGFAEAGPANGPPVILLHGWPYDIYSFVDVTPMLASAGHRVIVPYVRGYGTTRFLSNDTLRNGQQAAVAADVVALMDALKIEKRRWRGLIGGHARPTLSRPCGRNAARPWFP